MDTKEQWLQRVFLNPSSRRLFSLCAFLALIIPSLTLAGLYYQRIKADLTSFTIARKQATARMVALMLKERLDRSKDLATSLAARVQFQKFIREGNWVAAINILERIPAAFPYVDRIFLTDPKGTLMADFPSLQQTVGQNFAHRDWYKGVSKNWQPYVSEVYQRQAQPAYSMVAIAAPVINLDAPSEILGILVLQMRLETFSNWTKEIDLEPSGSIIVVDHTGKTVSHPQLDLSKNILDLSNVPSVQEVLQGHSGYKTFYSDAEHTWKSAAFEMVPNYNWGAIVSHTEAGAFRLRDEILKDYGIVFLVFILLNIGLIYAILHMLFQIIISGVSLQKANEELEAKIRERTRDLQIANDHLVQTNRDLEQFAYIASHDLQEPLRKVASFTELLAKKYLKDVDGEGKQYIGFITKGAERMQQLIKDLLQYSRSSGAPLDLRKCDLTFVLKEAMANLNDVIREKRAKITYDPLPEAAVHRNLLTLVFENLLTNAIKYCDKENPEIHISSGQANGEWIMSVADNGIGIDKSHHERIFRMFERLHADTEYSGTGIGLAITRRIIERHGGRIWVESNNGKGSIFKFSLPKRD